MDWLTPWIGSSSRLNACSSTCPMQHAESLDSQEGSVEIFSELARTDVLAFMITAMRNTADFARLHRDIIARFGRFPHRNAVLNREFTADEREYLEEGAPTFGQ